MNYAIGRRIGPAIFSREKSRFLNKEHLIRAHRFYEKHGGKTIIIARFIPIIRTFAPFVAGIGEMSYRALRGVQRHRRRRVGRRRSRSPGSGSATSEFVKKNFPFVILAIIVISLIPVVVEFWRAKRAGRKPEAS